MSTRTIRDGTLTLADGTGTPLTLTLTFDGNVYFRITKRNDAIIQRGVMSRWVNGGDAPAEISFQGQYSYLSRSASPNYTIYDALNKKSSCSAWVSTAASGDVYAVTLKFQETDPAGATHELLQFNEFVMDTLEFTEGDINMLFVTGRALVVYPTVTWPT